MVHLHARKLNSASFGRALLIASLCSFCAPNTLRAAPIDEFRLSDIEQKIRDLEATVREQARLISQLQSQPASSRSNAVPAVGLRNSSTELPWINAATWARLKPGMSELQVVELLGTPTQLRVADDQTRQLLYTLEIGRSGYLSGRITFNQGVVASIEIPTLR